MSDYPEHEKLKAVKDRSQACGEFLEWLAQQEYWLAEYDDDYIDLHPIRIPITRLLARFFEIDEEKLEAEKLQMLEAIRSPKEKA